MAIQILTGTAKVALPEAIFAELVTRLVRFGAPDAAERLVSQRSIRTEDKPVVREVLARWLRSAKPNEFDPDLIQLHHRLGRDLDHLWETARQ